jgi:hypothetical protein
MSRQDTEDSPWTPGSTLTPSALPPEWGTSSPPPSTVGASSPGPRLSAVWPGRFRRFCPPRRPGRRGFPRARTQSVAVCVVNLLVLVASQRLGSARAPWEGCALTMAGGHRGASTPRAVKLTAISRLAPHRTSAAVRPRVAPKIPTASRTTAFPIAQVVEIIRGRVLDLAEGSLGVPRVRS